MGITLEECAVQPELDKNKKIVNKKVTLVRAPQYGEKKWSLSKRQRKRQKFLHKSLDE